MIPKDQRLDRKEDSEEPLENQPLEWSEEDREMEDLGLTGQGFSRWVRLRHGTCPRMEADHQPRP